METARWDVSAKLAGVPAPVPPGVPDDTLRALRALLAERFGLAVHRETDDLFVFVLVQARADGRHGPALVQSNVDCPALIAGILTSGAPPPAGGPPCGLRGRVGSRQATGVPLSELVLALSGRVERAVVDRPALGGTWDFTSPVLRIRRRLPPAPSPQEPQRPRPQRMRRHSSQRSRSSSACASFPRARPSSCWWWSTACNLPRPTDRPQAPPAAGPRARTRQKPGSPTLPVSAGGPAAYINAHVPPRPST